MEWVRSATLAIALAAASAAPAAEDPALVLDATGTIEVGPDGEVRDYALSTELDPDVAALVDRTVRGWRFEPILVDGRPVIGQTRMRLTLEALPRDDAYVLRVADVSFGAPMRSDNAVPPFPRAALEAGIGARVILQLQLDARGNVERAHVEQVSLSGRAGKRGEFLRGRFADNSLEAALGWKFDMTEIVGGEPVPARVRVPVTFALGGPGDWQARDAFVPGPVHPAPWAAAASAPPRNSDEAQSFDSRFELAEDVIGTEL